MSNPIEIGDIKDDDLTDIEDLEKLSTSLEYLHSTVTPDLYLVQNLYSEYRQ